MSLDKPVCWEERLFWATGHPSYQWRALCRWSSRQSSVRLPEWCRPALRGGSIDICEGRSVLEMRSLKGQPPWSRAHARPAYDLKLIRAARYAERHGTKAAEGLLARLFSREGKKHGRGKRQTERLLAEGNRLLRAWRRKPLTVADALLMFTVLANRKSYRRDPPFKRVFDEMVFYNQEEFLLKAIVRQNSDADRGRASAERGCATAQASGRHRPANTRGVQVAR